MEMVCYCNKVTLEDMRQSYKRGNHTLALIIEDTGAMKHGRCAINNPKGVCCYEDLKKAFEQIQREES